MRRATGRTMKRSLNMKEKRVLSALSSGKELRWCDMPNAIGYTTLISMTKSGLIEQVPPDASPHSRDARWRRPRA